MFNLINIEITKSALSTFLFSAMLSLFLLSSCGSSDERQVEKTPVEEPPIDTPHEEEPDVPGTPPEPWPFPKMVSLWNHDVNLDITNTAKELGVNLVWTNDSPYIEQAWEDTHMFKSLQVDGINYVFGKINRVAWGWTHEGSVKHAKWVAALSKTHPEIIGLYLNDFYDEIEEGYRTEEQWREIIAAARSVNPKLHIWVPHYPHRNQGQHDFDFDIDGVVVNIWGNKPEQIENLEASITESLSHHPDKYVFAGMYLNSGNDERWLTEIEFKKVLGYYVDLMNEGKLVGMRLFSAGLFVERPEYISWAKSILARLER